MSTNVCNTSPRVGAARRRRGQRMSSTLVKRRNWPGTGLSAKRRGFMQEFAAAFQQSAIPPTEKPQQQQAKNMFSPIVSRVKSLFNALRRKGRA